ncbi:MAG TPA: hypothetical protein VMZ31_02385 [Phycisphaerae bacterium]|nr:hypothetical protein [Phycisphaerae bacterium]
MEGRIGNLSALWDRHQGGVQTILDGGKNPDRIRIAARVRLVKDGTPLLLLQESDPDPRLIICEEGPERIALRVMYSLLDEAGTYHGDGLSETILWSNGEVRLVFAVRLVDAVAHDRVTDAWVETDVACDAREVLVGTRGKKQLTQEDLTARRDYRFATQLPGRFVSMLARGSSIAFAWDSRDGADTDTLGGAGLWHGPGDRAPYYDTWGHLYSQWQGQAGWAAHPSGRLVLGRTERGVCLAWHWLHGARRTCGANFGLKAMIGLSFARKADETARRIRALHKPLVPQVEGGEFRCLDMIENALLYRKTADTLHLTFPRDPLRRTAHVRAFGLSCRGGVEIERDGRFAAPHLVSLAGQTDDPYGPNLARPGDRFVPIVGEPSKGPFEAVFSVPLSARRQTHVTVREAPGISMAYAKWDDRQVYVIRAGDANGATTALLSTQTLCLHDLRETSSHEPALVRVPLCWYPTNVQTRGHCLNELEQFRLEANGPDALRFRLVSTNPNHRARSTTLVEIARRRSAPVVQVDTRLDVLRQWDLDQIQYLNSFPSRSWQPSHWPDSWVVVMTADGRVMQEFFKEPRSKQRLGDRIQTWRNTLFFAQGSADRGNIFILVRNARPVRQAHGYMLCPVWLDSHFSIEDLKPPVRAGRSFEVSYTIGIAGDSSLSRTEAVEIGRRALAAGKLDFT